MKSALYLRNFYTNSKQALNRNFSLHTCTSLKQKNALLLCPSQGTQFVGMLSKANRNNPVYSSLINLSEDILGYSLLEKCQHGPKELLTRTLYSQPAIMLSTLLIAENLKLDKNIKWKSIVGYSLGELSALAAAGCIQYDDIFKIVKVRASAMEMAANLTPTGMISLEGLTVNEVNCLCADLSKRSSNCLFLATQLFEQGVTVGGSLDLLDMIMNKDHALLKNSKVKIAKVHVNGAFHTPYMQPAQDQLNEVLQKVTFYPTTDIKLYSNVTGKPYESVGSIKNLLVRQVCEPLLWYSVLQSINEDYSKGLYESMYELSRVKQIKITIGKVNKEMMEKVISLSV